MLYFNSTNGLSPVNMSAYLEIHDVHIGEVLIHHQTAIFYPYILLVDIGDFRQRFDTALFGQGVDVCGVLLGFGKNALCRCDKFIEGNISAVLGRGIDMDNLALVLGIPQASANLCEQGRNIQQRVGLVTVADDECNAVLVVKVAPLEAGRGVKVYLPHGV